MIDIYAIFHLNLAYSSISVKQRIEVIQQCYWPLLHLIENSHIPLGIELTGWTLSQINKLDAQWLNKFIGLIATGQCELVGSGYCQMIGPLVPYEVNMKNQHLGKKIYKDLLGINPSVALVNEMAYSSGLISVYRNAGYEGIIVDHDNINHAINNDNKSIKRPTHADGENGDVLPVLWSDSILFQKLQRFAHNDISRKDYLEYFDKRKISAEGPLCLYCNDAEIFDFRPARYSTELALSCQSEWKRIEHLFVQLHDDMDVRWSLPSAVLQTQIQTNSDTQVSCVLSSIVQPVPVKKQVKYNISRWAVTGRNDLWINTLCYRIYAAISNDNIDTEKNWFELLELWASDLRTHITSERWDEALRCVTALTSELHISSEVSDHYPIQLKSQDATLSNFDYKKLLIEEYNEGIYLHVKTQFVDLVLNQRRGLAIHKLAFAQHGFAATMGTLPQGYFDSIELAADFYSCVTVIELIKEHCRITDLEPGKQLIGWENDQLCIQTIIQTPKGEIVKQYFLHPEKEQLTVKISFPQWQRPYGSVRTGVVTLNPDAFEGNLYIQAKMGGQVDQIILLDRECAHEVPVSHRVSCSTGITATDGRLIIGDQHKKICISWDPAQCAMFPMLSHKIRAPSSLTRLFFSLCELDETFVEGGTLPAFEYTLTPC